MTLASELGQKYATQNYPGQGTPICKLHGPSIKPRNAIEIMSIQGLGALAACSSSNNFNVDWLDAAEFLQVGVDPLHGEAVPGVLPPALQHDTVHVVWAQGGAGEQLSVLHARDDLYIETNDVRKHKFAHTNSPCTASARLGGWDNDPMLHRTQDRGQMGPGCS